MMKSVTILLSTYNGEKYLDDQISSLLRQQGVISKILVRDDGSNDLTKKKLKEYEAQDILTWYTGENLGPARSFLDLVDNAPESDYYAFCDQDDVWKPNKLLRAVTKLEELEKNTFPKLYCSNYQLVNAALNELPDNGHVSTITFGAALVASNCTGCTAVFDPRLVEILRMGKPDVIVMHDDWIHKVCLAVGGTVIYDNFRTLKYRQHGGNVDGGIHSTAEKIKGVLKRVNNGECIRSRQLENIGKLYEGIMPEENCELLNTLLGCCNAVFLKRLVILWKKQIRTPYYRYNIGFLMAVILGYF